MSRKISSLYLIELEKETQTLLDQLGVDSPPDSESETSSKSSVLSDSDSSSLSSSSSKQSKKEAALKTTKKERFVNLDFDYNLNYFINVKLK